MFFGATAQAVRNVPGPQLNRTRRLELTKLDQIRAAEAKLLLSTYERNPILFVGGEGVHIVDEQGDRYLDLLSGIGVNALGYGNPVIEETIARQSKALIHTSNLFFHEGQAELALRLTERTGLDRAFFANTGTEAWEGAMKMARAYAGLQRSEGKQIGTKFLALEQSFHGRTFGAMSTTYKAKYREPFGPVVPGVEFVRFNDIEDLRAHFSNDVCAILLEAVQGEGGVRPLTQEFFAEARALADSTGALLIVDEIQSGMGRTGKWCAYQHYGIQPDITTLAKPLAGGIPMGAVLCTEAVARAFHPGMHGTTFGGGPLACAVAIAVIDTIEKDGLLAHATEVGDYFQDQLRVLAKRHQAIVDVRGKGLMLAAELDSADLAKLTVAEMLKRHIVINCTSDTVLRFLPPYILQREHVDTTIAALDEIFTQHSAAHAAATESAAKAAAHSIGGLYNG
jgi:acetylornithine aminotransferase/acetylornithine/N-succinyldiaminopimelate aminotransferase